MDKVTEDSSRNDDPSFLMFPRIHTRIENIAICYFARVTTAHVQLFIWLSLSAPFADGLLARASLRGTLYLHHTFRDKLMYMDVCLFASDGRENMGGVCFMTDVS